MGELLAGVARTVITPPLGIPMVGFAGRGPAEAVHDDLLATVLALVAGEERCILMAADLLGFGDHLTREVRAEVERRTGIAGSRVLLCASHTHYGPATGAENPAKGKEQGAKAQEPSGEGDTAPDVAAYTANLVHLLAGAAQAAVADAQPARIGCGQGSSDIGVNRREHLPDGRTILGQNPSGACDREVRIVRLDRADGPLAVLVNFACHPVTAGGAMRRITSDYVGTMRRLVEGATGAQCLFLQGAAGNINPVEMRHSLEPGRRLGVMLGGEVARLFEGTATSPAEGLTFTSEVLSLPAMTFPSAAEGESAVAELGAQRERLRAEGTSAGSLHWAETRLRRAEEMLQSARTGNPLPPIPAEVAAVRFGEAALVTAPGEIFTETGMDVKRGSPLGHTCYAGYTSGSIGYVPVPSAYPEGGYEVTHGCRVDPAAAGMIAERSLELLTRL